MDTNPRATLRILDGRHELALLGLTRDEVSFTLTYTITPPLPEDPGEGMPFLPVLEARDDLGNEYTDWGGVFGTPPDGSVTEGELTGQPAIPNAASSLAVTFTYLRGGEEMSYELTLPLSR
ncbi:hypothetical protein [Streptomyces sp. NPDC048473]|uniref:hypothetical protein n=1 Tax=unclassified Streptomyces TaxID=2593676 RepID=UPI0037148376